MEHVRIDQKCMESILDLLKENSLLLRSEVGKRSCKWQWESKRLCVEVSGHFKTLSKQMFTHILHQDLLAFYLGSTHFRIKRIKIQPKIWSINYLFCFIYPAKRASYASSTHCFVSTFNLAVPFCIHLTPRQSCTTNYFPLQKI